MHRTLTSQINGPHPAYFFLKKILFLVIFRFSSPAPKKFEQFKTYLSIRNSINSNEIDFFEYFLFSGLLLNEFVKTKQNDSCLRVAVEY